MKIPNNILKYRYHLLRPWLSQPFFWGLFFLSPVLNLFRVDMLSEQIVFLGGVYPFEHQYIKWIPMSFYWCVIAIAVTSVLFGRLFCGWVCPHNTLTEWTRPFRALVGLERKPGWLVRLMIARPGLRPVLPVLSAFLALFLTFLLTFCLASYVVSPHWILTSWLAGRPHIALAFGQGVFTLIGLFLLYIGHDFCRSCCPYGMGQSVSAYVKDKWRPMEIRFKADGGGEDSGTSQCGTCSGCRSSCPVDLDPRFPENLHVGRFDGCFNCGECIDACKHVQSFSGKAGLLSFSPGTFISKPLQLEQMEQKAGSVAGK